MQSKKFSMRPKHFSCVLNSSMVTSMATRILANGTVRKFQVDTWTHGLNSTIFSIFKKLSRTYPRSQEDRLYVPLVFMFTDDINILSSRRV